MPNVQIAAVFAEMSSVLGDDVGANDHTNRLLVHLEERIAVRVSRWYGVAVGLIVAFGEFVDRTDSTTHVRGNISGSAPSSGAS